MKLFSSGGNRKDMEVQQTTAKSAVAPKPAKAGKVGKVKKILSKEQRRKRIVIISSIVAVCVLSIAVVAALFIRPPEIKKDATIKDTENGDQINTSALLNGGDRIADFFTFVVCATDEDETRTDAIMVVSFDTKNKQISVMNIPRDTMSNVSRSGAARKINAAYGTNKGIEQTKNEVEMLLGFKPDKYIVVNFKGIADIVDVIGGVDYEIPFRMKYDDPSQNLAIDLYAGMQHLNGKQTVEFLRWRKNNEGIEPSGYENGDEGRVTKQQEFLKYLKSQVITVGNVIKVRELATAIFDNTKTDITAGEMLWLALQTIQVKDDNIRMFTLPGYGEMSTANSTTAFSFYFPYYQETLDLVNQYFNPYSQEITTLDMVSGPESSYSYGGGYTNVDEYDDYTWGDTGASAVDPEPSGEDAGTGTGVEGGGTGTGGTGTVDPGTVIDPENNGGAGTGGTGTDAGGTGTGDPGIGGTGTSDSGTGGMVTGDPGTGGTGAGDPGTDGTGAGDPGTGTGDTGSSGTGDTGSGADTGSGNTGGEAVSADPGALIQ